MDGSHPDDPPGRRPAARTASATAPDASPTNAKVRYHLGELEAALDPDDPYHSLPDYADASRVLDIGCGIGQTLLAAPGRPEALRVGVDIDVEALVYGARHRPGPALAAASVERLPFADASFDRISSRVALPYTRLAVALDEIARVLAPGGRAWMTFHTATFVRRQWREALRARRPKDLVFRSYVLANGLWLHRTGGTFPFPGTRRTESFQSASGVRRMLAERGFEAIEVELTRGGSLLVTAHVRPGRTGTAVPRRPARPSRRVSEVAVDDVL